MDSGDDLDELLDEVEKRFCRNVSVASSVRESPSESGKCGKDNDEQKEHRFNSTKPELSMSSITEDVDSFLEELLEEDHESSLQAETEPFTKGPKVEKKLPSQSGGRKCFPVFVGGSSVTNGVGTATSKRSCGQLRCVSCDFWVLMFDDCEWDLSCDYLFLRNNMPDCQKLRSKLKKKTGVRAYACQCSWFSSSELTDLRDLPQLRWVCGKHRD